ncbi:hypothetical protein HYV86_01950 [Candidatus Woesearchaeota archaeon]|nr:hypothetical protein [Candidatus Woesearchaeota archaeon]
MSARPFGITLLTTLYVGCVDPSSETTTSTHSTAIAYSPISPNSSNSPAPPKQEVSLEERTQTLTQQFQDQHINGVEVMNIFAVSEYGGKIDERPKDPHKDQTVTLYAVVQATTPNGQFYFTSAPSLTLNGKKIPKNKIKPWDYSTDLKLQWKKIEFFDNFNQFYQNDKEENGCNAYDPQCNRIKYVETEWKTGWEQVADAHPTTLRDQFSDSKTGVGVMRYSLQLTYGQKEFQTPSIEDMRTLRSSQQVLRISFANDQWEPWLNESSRLFNTPYMWASTRPIVEGYLASDCADLLVFGLKRAGSHIDYTNSQGLRTQGTTHIVTAKGHNAAFLFESDPNQRIPFDANNPQAVHPGDILIWGGKGKSPHAAGLILDNGNGILDINDLALDTLLQQPQFRRIGNITPRLYPQYPFEIVRPRLPRK